MATTEPNIGQFYIAVDGTDLPTDLIQVLEDALVEDDLAQPATFTLRFRDPQLNVQDRPIFKLGAQIRLSAADTRGTVAAILHGEITALETQLDQHASLFIVRGYDRSHRLYRASKTRTFLRQTDSNVASQIAREAGLQADVQGSSVQHEYIIQDNQTDIAFLRARAERIGYRLEVRDSTLSFRAAEQADGAPIELAFGPQLLSFRARLTAATQPNEVQVRGWDPRAKRALIGQANTPVKPNAIGVSQTAAELAQQAFNGAAKLVVTHEPVRSQGEADKLAQAILDTRSGDALSAEGRCRGEPKIRAGSKVKVTQVGTRLSGTYYVTASRHEYTVRHGYETTFFVSGRQPTSLTGVLERAPQPHGAVGVVVGIVTNCNDPDKLARVKLKLPWLDDQNETDWARVVGAGAGPGRGMIMLPEVNDEVLVAFEQGDLHRPYVLGGLWNGSDKPPVEAVKDGKVQQRALKTRAGHQLLLDDTDGKQQVQIKTAGGHTITITDGDKKIEIASSGGQKVTLDDGGKAVRIEGTGDIEISGPGGALKIAASGVELSSKASLKVEANAMLDVKTSAVLSIQGSLVKIN